MLHRELHDQGRLQDCSTALQKSLADGEHTSATPVDTAFLHPLKTGATPVGTASFKSTTSLIPTMDSYEVSQCYAYPRLDFWAKAIVYGTHHKKGDGVGWTVGSSKAIDMRQTFSTFAWKNSSVTWEQALDRLEAVRALNRFQPPANPRPFHIITSTQGQGVEWCMRIHYYHFRKIRAQCRAEWGAACEMGGFTRLLHGGASDRPWGFKQWVKIANIPEKYVFMSEPDHIMLRPIPNLMKGDDPAAFPFFYIEPTSEKSVPIVKRHTGIQDDKQLWEIAPIGSSPVFMTFADMEKVMQIWSNVSVSVYKDPEAQKKGSGWGWLQEMCAFAMTAWMKGSGWGWVQEMYAFAMAAWMVGLKKIDLVPELIAQPPYDAGMEERFGRPFYFIHYTYPMRFLKTGELLKGKTIGGDWVFDKRALGGRLPRNFPEPPPAVINNMVRAMIRAFNEATDAIPCWDDYYASEGEIKQDCTEPPKGWLALQTPEDKDAFPEAEDEDILPEAGSTIPSEADATAQLANVPRSRKSAIKKGRQ
eukprot:gene12386-15579_t